MKRLVHVSLTTIITYFLTLNIGVFAGTVSGTVADEDGNPIEHAVITLVSGDETIVYENAVMPPPVMTQRDIQFTPFVLPIVLGTTVTFPNEDKVRHHVYSFSKVKRFELELYSQEEEKSILFDAPGVVALGCNIHDSMLAFIYVAKSNLFVKTDEQGVANLDDIPPGTYEAYVWHPRLSGSEEDTVQKITVDEEGVSTFSFDISLKRERNRKRKTY